MNCWSNSFIKVGNTISDVIKKIKPVLKKKDFLLKKKLKENDFFLLTLHRPDTDADSTKLKK